MKTYANISNAIRFTGNAVPALVEGKRCYVGKMPKLKGGDTCTFSYTLERSVLKYSRTVSWGKVDKQHYAVAVQGAKSLGIGDLVYLFDSEAQASACFTEQLR